MNQWAAGSWQEEVKRKKLALKKKQAELSKFDGELRHHADMKISLHLDGAAERSCWWRKEEVIDWGKILNEKGRTSIRPDAKEDLTIIRTIVSRTYDDKSIKNGLSITIRQYRFTARNMPLIDRWLNHNKFDKLGDIKRKQSHKNMKNNK
jgi:hypothetical protein